MPLNMYHFNFQNPIITANGFKGHIVNIKIDFPDVDLFVPVLSNYDKYLQSPDPCKQSPEPGNCLERYEMWYYDYYRDSCSRFTYTGCGGNNNR